MTRVILVLLLAFSVSCSSRDAAEADCKKSCADHSAVFNRVTKESFGTSKNCYSCWCRRDMENNGLFSPMRVW